MITMSDLVTEPGYAPKKGQYATKPVSASGRVKARIGKSPDLARILKLPRRGQPTEGSFIDAVTATFSKNNEDCRCKKIRPKGECITRLRHGQTWGLYEMRKANGMLGNIGVGHGKTILWLLSPLAIRECKTALLLCPPKLVPQLIEEYQMLSQHFHVPSMIVHGKTWSNVVPDMPNLHVMPYSRLSRENASDFISRLGPDLVIADETHKLKDPQTATTARVLRHFENHPGTRFVAGTGTLFDKSIKEYAHLLKLALGEGSPLPLHDEVLSDWAMALDASKAPAPPGALYAMCEPGEHILSGYHRRLTQTLGFVSTKKSAVTAKIEISRMPDPAVPAVVADMIEGVSEKWQRPDEEELVEPHQRAACCRQLACGFYYRWRYPRGEPEDLIDEWFSIRQMWNKELREALKPRREYLDSPYLLMQAAKRFISGDTTDMPVWDSEHYTAWMEIKDQVVPEPESVRVDDYLVRSVADWAADNKGIIWYEHGDFGRWVQEHTGLSLHSGGPKGPARLKRLTGDESALLSIKANGTGVDGLQRLYSTQLITQPPSSGKNWEQLLGRLHRTGQLQPVVYAWVYRHTEELNRAVGEALLRSAGSQAILGSEQKLMTGIK